MAHRRPTSRSAVGGLPAPPRRLTSREPFDPPRAREKASDPDTATCSSTRRRRLRPRSARTRGPTRRHHFVWATLPGQSEVDALAHVQTVLTEFAPLLREPAAPTT